jgi:hypothetical protein
VPSGSVYTLTQDLHAISVQVNAGVTVDVAGFRIFCQGAVTGGGTIRFNGNNGANGGTAAGNVQAIYCSQAGGAGNTGAGTAGAVGTFGGTGGAGGSGSSAGSTAATALSPVITPAQAQGAFRDPAAPEAHCMARAPQAPTARPAGPSTSSVPNPR